MRRDVESGVVAVAAASGLDNLEIDITNQSLLVQCRTPAGTLMTVLRVVRSSSRDFARLVAVHRLVEDLAAGRVDLDEANDRLRRISAQKRPWPRWFVSLAFGGLAASVAMLLGAGATAILLGLVSAVLVDRVGLALGRVGLPAFYVSAFGAAIATVFAWVAFVLGHSGSLGVSAQDFAYVVAGGIVVLLPGRAMASSVEDAITGYPVTGAGRLFGVLLTAAGIIVGVAAGLSLALRADHALDLGLTAPDALSFAGSGPPRRSGWSPVRSVGRRARSPCAAGDASCCRPRRWAVSVSSVSSSCTARPGSAASPPSPWPASPSASAGACWRCAWGHPAWCSSSRRWRRCCPA